MNNNESKLKELLHKTAVTLKHTKAQLQETEEKIKSLQGKEEDPIAIIGMACRFPGGANSPDEFWQLLHQGYNGITKVAAERWNANSTSDTLKDFFFGGFLQTAIDQFDAQFFDIAPKEAEWIDPQHRLMLELAWEAIESGAIDPDSIMGTQTGIYLGICHSDYNALISKHNKVPPNLGTGVSTSALAGRLSNFLGAQGPSMAIDTACSSALVAVHTACLSLQSHECCMALAGGINLILTPHLMASYYQEANLLAKDNRCKTFDAKADGFVRGEGAGIVVLKRLSDALKDKDLILAVIRASGVNQNGAKSLMTVPNGEAQKELIHQVLTKANLSPHQINYFEAHGSGTMFGDAIEANAIAEALGSNRAQDNKLLVGSVKTNIGYLEAAAGIAGLIKVVLALNHGEIPSHKNFETLNPLISSDAVKIPTEPVAWPPNVKTRRLAGINSFGVSGTNAHAIIEEAPSVEILLPNKIERPLHILTLSAKTNEALNEKIKQYQQFLEKYSSIPLADIAYTANIGRRHFQVRAAYVAETSAEIVSQMKSNQVQKGQIPSSPPKVLFFFPDEGVEYSKMGRQLYETQPVFRKAFGECSELVGNSLENFTFEDDSPNPLVSQAALFSFEYALAKLWINFGVIPDYMIGKGLGEYVSATLAKVIGLHDALKLITAGQKMGSKALTEIDMKKARTEFDILIKNIKFNPPEIRMIRISEKNEESEWLKEINQYFEPEDTAKKLLHDAQNLFLEISPQLVSTKNFFSINMKDIWLPSLCIEGENWRSLLDSLAKLYILGVPINWRKFDSVYQRQKVPQPTYPFQRQRHWVENL